MVFISLWNNLDMWKRKYHNVFHKLVSGENEGRMKHQKFPVRER